MPGKLNPQKVSNRRKAKARKVAKKPRTLNAVYSDAQCWIFPDPGNGFLHRVIEVKIHSRNLSRKSALRLSQWLAEAAAWKAEE